MPITSVEKASLRRYKKLVKKRHREGITLPFGKDLWEYRMLVEKKKTRKLSRILNAMARYTKAKSTFPYPTKVEEFMKECDDSDSSYGRDESILTEGYYVKSKIYNGSPGVKIYLCEKSVFANKSKRDHVAVKVINLKKTFGTYIEDNLRRELDIILQVRHPFMIETMCVLFRKKQYFIFMRYAEKHDLFAHLLNYGALPESCARLWIAQLGSALTYLHSLEIAHNDLCCENVLITEHLNLKLTDFEYATRIRYEMGKAVPLVDFRGSPEYASPEILQGQPYSAFGADTWALGVILYAMVTAHLPFSGQTPDELMKSQRGWKMKDSPNYSNDLLTLFRKIFQFKSKHRYNLHRFMHVEWFRKDTRLSTSSHESSANRPSKGECRPLDDPGRLRLVGDPAQVLTDGAEVVHFHPFLRERPSKTTLTPIVYKDEDLGATASDDQSFGIPFNPGEEQARHFSHLETLWRQRTKGRKQEKVSEKKKKSEFAQLLYKAYKTAKRQNKN